MTNLSKDELVDAYRRMRTIREFENRIHREFAAGEIPGFVHLYAGEEACAVGVCSVLTDEDRISSTHRGHGHCIAKGVDITAMMAEIYGKGPGICGGKGGSMHIADLARGMMGANGIVGGGAPLVCGAGLAAKLQDRGRVAVCFLGDGASNQGTTLESLNLASAWHLPCVFVIENNGYAEATGSRWSVTGSAADRGAAFGMPGLCVDGHDFFAVREAARMAVERARAGGGPTLIELRTDRFFGHYEGDQQTYRGPGELEDIVANRDPLLIFSRQVIDAGLLTSADLANVDADVARLIDAAVSYARAAPVPDPASLTTDVYVSY